MVTGELKLQETLIGFMTDPELNKLSPFTTAAAFAFLLFSIVMSIALFNMSVGLAIGDTKLIHRNATLKRIAVMVWFYTAMENSYGESEIACISLRNRKARPKALTIYPNKKASGLMVPLGWLDVRSVNAKARSQAIEEANRQQFQKAVGNWMTKMKRHLKNVSHSLDRHSEFTKLLLQKMEIDWRTSVFCEEEGQLCEFAKDLKSVKSEASANWERLSERLSILYVNTVPSLLFNG